MREFMTRQAGRSRLVDSKGWRDAIRLARLVFVGYTRAREVCVCVCVYALARVWAAGVRGRMNGKVKSCCFTPGQGEGRAGTCLLGVVLVRFVRASVRGSQRLLLLD